LSWVAHLTTSGLLARHVEARMRQRMRRALLRNFS